MRKKALCAATIFLYCLCLSTIAQSQVKKLYLHPKAPGSENQSSFVDSIEFTPLQMKEGVVVSTYNNIQVTEKYFLVTDYPNKAIIIYSKNGAFHKLINFKKFGTLYPGYDKHTNQIVFFGYNKAFALTSKDIVSIGMDWNNPRNKKYFRKYVIDLADTTFAIKKESPNEFDISKAYHYAADYYFQGQINTSPLYKDSLDYEVSIYKNNKRIKAFFPYNHINEPRFLFAQETSSLNVTSTPSVYLVTRPFCDTIYRLQEDSLTPAYQVVLPLENSLPPSFASQSFKNKTERDNFNRNNAWMFRQVFNFYETPRFIFLTIGYLLNYEAYIYNKQSNITYKARNVKPDSSQYNLKLLTEYGAIRDNDRFYKLQKAGDLLSFFNQNKNVPVPKELQPFINGTLDKDAPVIISFKLKD